MRFCVRCGKTVEKTVNGLCKECLLIQEKFLKEHAITITICRFCGKLVENPNMSLEDAIKNSLKKIALGSLKSYKIIEDKHNLKVLEVLVSKKVDSIVLENCEIVKVKIRWQCCQRCMKIRGGSYAVRIQIRACKETLDEIERKFLIEEWYEKLKKDRGIDVFFQSKGEARKFLNKLSNYYIFTKKESAKLVTRKDGKDIYRVTISIRIPEWHKGDIVEYEGRVYQILSSQKNFVKLVDLETLKEMKIAAKNIDKIRLRKKYTDLGEGVVKSIIDDKAIISYKGSEIEIITTYPLKVGEIVKIFESKGKVYIVGKNGG